MSGTANGGLRQAEGAEGYPKSGETRTNFLQVAPILPARWVQQPVYGLIAVVNAVMFLGL